MPETLEIFHQSPPSHHQMPLVNVESQFNWLIDSDFPPPGIFDVTDHFPSSEFAGSSFTNFSSSSVNELSKVTEQNRCFTKRKYEFDDEVEGDSQKRRAEEDESEVKMSSRIDTCNGNSKPNMDPKLDCIYVRVRRGQATDSHSLAERARREKIKKKMQCLQDLVPGCDKITNKAAMLDEIINYVQWLQRQVEFLTMKLAASTASLDFKMENSLPNKQLAASPVAVNSAHQHHGPTQLRGASNTSAIEMPIDFTSLAPPVQVQGSVLEMQISETWAL